LKSFLEKELTATQTCSVKSKENCEKGAVKILFRGYRGGPIAGGYLNKPRFYDFIIETVLILRVLFKHSVKNLAGISPCT